LARALLRRGLVSTRRLAQIEAQSHHRDVRLADSVRLSLSLPPEAIAEAESEATGAQLIDPIKTPPDTRLIAAYGPEKCLRDGV
jgi:hypothetical protein